MTGTSRAGLRTRSAPLIHKYAVVASNRPCAGREFSRRVAGRESNHADVRARCGRDAGVARGAGRRLEVADGSDIRGLGAGHPATTQHHVAMRTLDATPGRRHPVVDAAPGPRPAAEFVSDAPRPDEDELVRLLGAAQAGDADAGRRVFALLYRDLRTLAHARLRGHRTMTLLDTTGLVHETYLRLVGDGRLDVGSRGHFFAYASRVMRSVIVDTARARLAARRGGGQPDLPLDTAAANSAGGEDAALVRVNDALADLAKVNPRLAQVVEMRYFGGLTEPEIAEVLGVSDRTVKRDWEKARLLLAAALR